MRLPAFCCYFFGLVTEVTLGEEPIRCYGVEPYRTSGRDWQQQRGGMTCIAIDPHPWLIQVGQEERVIAARDDQLDLAPSTEVVVDGEGRELNQVR